MKGSVSRRGFLQTAGAGTVTMWIPTHASGYTAPEMREKAAAASTLGVSKWELDTPALCVDLDKMEANMATMRQKLAATGTGVVTRPPAIAKLQLAAGAVGVCTAKVSEAEALFANGVEKILMTTCNVSASKIRRAMKIRKANRTFIQAVDNPKNAQDLSDAAKEAGIVADVVRKQVEVGVDVVSVCTPPVSFTFGSVIAHILTVSVVRRQTVISVLRELGVRDAEIRDPIEWERMVAARG